MFIFDYSLRKLSTTALAEASILARPKEKLIGNSAQTPAAQRQLTGSQKREKKASHLEEYASFNEDIQLFKPHSNSANTQSKANDGKKFSLDSKSKFHKTLLKKNPHILINICISSGSGNIEEQSTESTNLTMSSSSEYNGSNKSEPNETVLYENHDLFIPKKKSSLLKTSSSLANKKKIKFIYGQEPSNFYSFSSRSNSRSQQRPQHSTHHVKFNDVIELYDPEYNNRTLHSLSEFSSHLHQNKSTNKHTNDFNNKTSKNFPLVKFCYEEPAVKQQQQQQKQQYVIQPNLDMKPTRVTKTKLDNFDSNFIYCFEDLLNPLINVNDSEEDLVDLADTNTGSDISNSVESSKLAKSIKNNEVHDEVTLIVNGSSHQANGLPPKFTSIINKQQRQLQPQSAMKTRGIVQVKSSNLLQSFRVNQPNQEVQIEISEFKINETSSNIQNKQDEIELKIKLDSDDSIPVINESVPEPETLPQSDKIETASDKELNSTVKNNLEKNYFDSLSRRNLVNMRRSSKSGEPCNELELNSIFKQIYNRNRTIIAAASALSNAQPTNVLRRFSSVKNSPKTINSTSM